MVVVYQNKFIKIFIISAVLWVSVAAIFIYIITSMNSVLNLSSDQQALDRLALISILYKIGYVISGFAFIFTSWSGYLLARAKGYSGWLGILFSLVVISLLPDKTKHAEE